MNIILTGGTGALGGAVLEALDAGGNNVVSLVRSVRDGASGRVREIAVKNLSDPVATRTAIDQARDMLGGIDAVVHLVGGFDWIPVSDSTWDDWSNLYATNVGTTLNLLHAVLPHLAEGASIVCVGAASAQPAMAGMAPYAAAKSAVARIVEAFSQEMRPRRIRVNAIAPAIIDTPRNRADMPDADPSEWTSPDAIADVIAFLISPQSRAINGALVPVTNNG